MKGVIEMNWKILVAIIVTVIGFVIVFLILMGILKPENLSKGAYEICLLMISKLKIFGFGAEQAGICEAFRRA